MSSVKWRPFCPGEDKRVGLFGARINEILINATELWATAEDARNAMPQKMLLHSICYKIAPEAFMIKRTELHAPK